MTKLIVSGHGDDHCLRLVFRAVSQNSEAQKADSWVIVTCREIIRGRTQQARERDSARFAIWRGWPDGGWGGWRADRRGGGRGGKQRRQSSLHSRIYSSNRERDINLWNMSNLAFSKDIESTNHSPRAPFLYSLPPGEEWESASERERRLSFRPATTLLVLEKPPLRHDVDGWWLEIMINPIIIISRCWCRFPLSFTKKVRMEDQTQRPPRF